ncbi:MAG TPA: Flp pilus assembly protein CpaB, partial [Candidatus Sulfomarinibacteraceae bacterium]|nr:Flp pilus assembly protein CpaB [Candidatus Sulfomarinibacteraceae bacterium]
MEMEYKDTNRRGKAIIVLGLILAIAAGGAAFFLINQAQQQAGQEEIKTVAVVVAARDIAARKPIEPDDLIVRRVPLDATNATGVVAAPDELIGRVLAVTVFKDQLVTTNLIAAAAGGGSFSILGPTETVAPDSEAWRAVSITMADASAVGGLLRAGETVDIFATATVNVPQELIAEGQYYTDRSTKLTYQNVVILARSGSWYIIRASIAVAEELAHLAAVGNVTFSAALRPEQDVRTVDASRLGATTNLIITRYGLPIPETYPARGGAIATLPPLLPSPSPSAEP